MSLRKFLLPAVFATTLLHAEVQDAPAPDLSQILQILKTLKEQQVLTLRAARDRAMREASSAAASPSAATAAWEEAIRQTQFEGAPKEGTAFRDWKDKVGDGLKSREAGSAAQLFFRWLLLTLQHANGKPAKEQIADVVQYTKDLALDKAAMETFVENMKKDEELAKSGKHGMRTGKNNDGAARQLHDTFLRGLNGSAPVKAMGIEELLKTEKWANNPGDLDGIYNQILLPVFRADKDPRIFEYWDLKIKREGEAAAKTKLAYDAEKFTNERHPALVWNRAQEYLNIGQKNRAVGEMVRILKTYPKHPDMGAWISELEGILTPPVAPPVPEEPIPGAGPSRPPGS